MVILLAIFFTLMSTAIHGHSHDQFALIAHDIAHNFSKNSLLSTFGKELFQQVSRLTNNFSDNLSASALRKAGLPELYLDYMATEYCTRKKNVFIALVWPITVGNDDLIETIFKKYGHIVYSKKIFLHNRGFANFLSQIPAKSDHPGGLNLWFNPAYRHHPLRIFLFECKPNSTPYDAMRKQITSIFGPQFFQNFENQYGKQAVTYLYTTTVCKHEIRKAVNLSYALHFNDSHDETLTIADVVFNNNSLQALNWINPSDMSNFKALMPQLHAWMNNNQLERHKLVIYNSAVLSAFGLRDCNDIDFLCDRSYIYHGPALPTNLSLQNGFFKRGYLIVEDKNGRAWILEDAPDAFPQVSFFTSSQFVKKYSIDDLLYDPRNHFYYNGFKFATLDFMHYFKGKRGRPKDIRDAQLIRQHLDSRK